MADTAALTIDQFEAHLGTTFTAVAVNQAGGFPVELVAARRLEADENAPRQDPFELVFESEGEAYLGQGTYRFQHEGMGDVDIFVVPLGHNEESGRMRYQAVFN